MSRLFAAVLTVAALLSTSPVLAQEDPPSLDHFSAMRFFPAVGPGNYLAIDGATVPGHLVPSAGLHLDFAYRPFTLYDATCAPDDETNCDVQDANTHLVRWIASAHLSFAIGLGDRVQLGLLLPLAIGRGDGFEYTTTDGTPTVINGGTSNRWTSFAIGDPRLSAKVRLIGEGGDGLAMAVAAWASAPTGDLVAEGRYLGEDTLVAGGHFVAQFIQQGFHVAANVGGFYRPERVLFSTAVGSQLTYGGAVGYQVTPLVLVFGEVHGGSSFTAEVDENPLEARIAGRLTQGDFSFELGAGGGLVSGVGIPVFRVVGGARWAPIRADADGDGVLDGDDGCPDQEEDVDGWQDEDGCPEEDNDDDGMLDGVDPCPDEAEDRDGHEDEDGCPDRDNDGDGVPDGYDSCPDVPEDLDGDRDEDGCPDNDRDRDGIEDDVDQCPDQEEDTDGFGDEDGCPEDDFDGDGVPDDGDECPDEAEILNGVEDEDGCPEPDADGDRIPDQSDRCPDEAETINGRTDDDGCADGDALVRVSEGRIVVDAPILFRPNSARIRNRQVTQALNAVATLIKRNPQLQRIRIEAHTDNRISAEEGRRLTQQQAETVMRHFVGQGVPETRLRAVGVGQDRPADTNETIEGREANRRVEFYSEPIAAAAADRGDAAPATDAPEPAADAPEPATGE